MKTAASHDKIRVDDYPNLSTPEQALTFLKGVVDATKDVAQYQRGKDADGYTTFPRLGSREVFSALKDNPETKDLISGRVYSKKQDDSLTLKDEPATGVVRMTSSLRTTLAGIQTKFNSEKNRSPWLKEDGTLGRLTGFESDAKHNATRYDTGSAKRGPETEKLYQETFEAEKAFADALGFVMEVIDWVRTPDPVLHKAFMTSENIKDKVDHLPRLETLECARNGAVAAMNTFEAAMDKYVSARNAEVQGIVQVAEAEKKAYIPR